MSSWNHIKSCPEPPIGSISVLPCKDASDYYPHTREATFRSLIPSSYTIFFLIELVVTSFQFEDERMSSLSSAFANANRGNLTTIFTPPASCLTETTIVSFPTTALANTTSTFTTTKIFKNHFSWGDGNCYPSTIATSAGSTRWENGYYYCAFGNAEVGEEKLITFSTRYMSIWMDICMPDLNKRTRIPDHDIEPNECGDVLSIVCP